jgi:hypothetical protein
MKFIHREVEFNLKIVKIELVFFLKKMILKIGPQRHRENFTYHGAVVERKKMELETRIILEGHQGTKGAKKALELLCKNWGDRREKRNREELFIEFL